MVLKKFYESKVKKPLAALITTVSLLNPYYSSNAESAEEFLDDVIDHCPKKLIVTYHDDEEWKKVDRKDVNKGIFFYVRGPPEKLFSEDVEENTVYKLVPTVFKAICKYEKAYNDDNEVRPFIKEILEKEKPKMPEEVKELDVKDVVRNYYYELANHVFSTPAIIGGSYRTKKNIILGCMEEGNCNYRDYEPFIVRFTKAEKWHLCKYMGRKWFIWAFWDDCPDEYLAATALKSMMDGKYSEYDGSWLYCPKKLIVTYHDDEEWKKVDRKDVNKGIFFYVRGPPEKLFSEDVEENTVYKLAPEKFKEKCSK